MKIKNMNTSSVSVYDKIIELLNDISENEYQDLFIGCSTDDEKLQILTSESMLGVVFISSIEDEFSIEFENDEIDIDFFTSIEILENKIKKHL